MRGRAMVTTCAKSDFASASKVAPLVGDSRRGIPAASRAVEPARHAYDKGGELMLVVSNRTRWSMWSLSPCTRIGILVALLSGLVAGCIPLSAKANVTQIGGVPTPSGGIGLSVFFSRDFSPEMRRSLGEDMAKCVTRGLATTAPEVRLVSEEEFHHTIFGLKPGEVMLSEDTIGTLLARPDTRRRVGESGITHLVLVRNGATTRQYTGDGFIIGVGGSVAGVEVGYGNAIRSTRLTVSILELASGRAGGVEANSEGHQGIFTIFPLVVGWVHMTESASCTALGMEVARAISERLRDEGH